MKVAVLLSGSGVYDGTEIQEGVFALLALNQQGVEVQCTAPNVNQHHVVNHISGEEMQESRNVLIESARIARGEIVPVEDINVSDFDGLVIPGGFGTAKNHTKWAFSGPDGEIVPAVKELILSFVKAGKPIAGLCMGPTTIAKALEGSGISARLTVGSNSEASPYEIEAISQGMEKTGAVAEMKTVREILIDDKNKIVSAPCYMMEASISEIHDNIQQAIDAFTKLLR